MLFPHIILTPPIEVYPPHKCKKKNVSPQTLARAETMCSHCYIFVLISYSLDAQVVLILISIDVHYSQKAVFSFEKGLNCQNHSFSGYLHLVKKSSPVKFPIPPSLPQLGGGDLPPTPTLYSYFKNPDYKTRIINF